MGCQSWDSINLQGVGNSLLTQYKINSCKVSAAERIETSQGRRIDFFRQCGVVNRVKEEFCSLVKIFCLIIVKACFAFNFDNRQGPTFQYADGNFSARNELLNYTITESA